MTDVMTEQLVEDDLAEPTETATETTTMPLDADTLRKDALLLLAELNEHAEKTKWCSEYQDFMERLHEKLNDQNLFKVRTQRRIQMQVIYYVPLPEDMTNEDYPRTEWANLERYLVDGADRTDSAKLHRHMHERLMTLPGIEVRHVALSDYAHSERQIVVVTEPATDTSTDTDERA